MLNGAQTSFRVTGFKQSQKAFSFDFPKAPLEFFFAHDLKNKEFEMMLEMPVYFGSIFLEKKDQEIQVCVDLDTDEDESGNEYDFEKMARYINRYIFKVARMRQPVLKALMQKLPYDIARNIMETTDFYYFSTPFNESLELPPTYRWINDVPFHVLIQQEDFAMVTELLRIGVNPNASTRPHQRPLGDALRLTNHYNAWKMAKLLLSNGATIRSAVFDPTSKWHTSLPRFFWPLFGMTGCTLNSKVVRDLVDPAVHHKVNMLVDMYNTHYQK